MKYMNLPGTDVKISRIALGCDVFGSSLDRDSSYELMDYYAENGGTILDTAHIYGDFGNSERHASEKTVGRWLRDRGMTGKMRISTKGAHPRVETMTVGRCSRQEILDDIDGSLECLGIDRIDVYWLHRDDTALDAGEILETLAELVKTGRCRCFGVSNWHGARIDEANEYAEKRGLPKICCSQIQYALADVNPQTIDQTLVKMDGREFDYYRGSKLPVFAFSSQGKGYFSKLAEGSLSDGVKRMYDNPKNAANYEVLKRLSAENGYTVGQNAVAYLLSNPYFQVIPILGCKKTAQLKESMTTPGEPINFELFQR